jgi:predicted DNA-binding protein (MmcQ/YjbR family)
MSVDWVRRYCLALPHTTEIVQWGHDLVFKVAGKMYAAAPLEPPFDVWLTFKCTPEEFAELTDRPGIIPAPYMARAYWVALESEDALPAAEVRRLLRQSYELVVARLPQKTRAALEPKARVAPRIRRARE